MKKLKRNWLYIVYVILLTLLFIWFYPQAVKDGEWFFWVCSYIVWLGLPLIFKNE